MAATKDYNALAASKIHRPADVQRRPKILVYGRNKKGKTTFGVSGGIDKTLVLDPEKGTDEMKTKNPHVWPIEKWEDLEDAYNFLRYGKHEYTWVVVDGLTRMSNMSLRYVMRLAEERSLDRQPGMVQQRDYGKSGELMRELLTKFHNLPLGVVYTAQERMVDASDAEDDEDIEGATAMYVPDLPKGVRGMVNSLVDVIGRIYVVRVEDSDGKMVSERRLWLGESVKYDTGYRSDFVLPDNLRHATLPRLVKLMREGTLKKRA